jgi:acetyl esterase/lipase
MTAGPDVEEAMRSMFAVVALLLLVFTGRPAHAEAGVRTSMGIPYVAGSRDEDQTLDVYAPDVLPAPGARLLPVHVYAHGGGWGRGDKRLGKTSGPFYVKHGAIFISLNYRLAPRNRYPDFMHDLAAAMRWVKDHAADYGGDANNIVLSGHSAGAHVVALLATHPDFLKAQGLPLNMFKAVVPVDTASFNFLVDPYGMFVRRQKKIREDAFGTDRNVLVDASPTLQAEKARKGELSPFEIMVSGKRPDAVEQSRAFEQALRNSGNEAITTVVPDKGHAMMNQALADPDSPVAQVVLRRLGLR